MIITRESEVSRTVNAQPKVSVVMPVYQAEAYLEQCLDSIARQTLGEFEILCVDDGSTDRSGDILRRYADGDDRFVLLREENRGAAAARNNGFDRARGEYVIFLDSDDFFDPRLLEKTVAAADAAAADIVLFDIRKFDDRTGEVLEKSRYLVPERLPKQTVFSRRDVPDLIFNLTTPAPWSRLYRTDFLRRTGLRFQEIANTDDFYFGYCTLALAGRICAVEEPLVYYRVNNGNSLDANRYKQISCVFAAISAVYDELNRTGVYDEVSRSFAQGILSTVRHNLDEAPTGERVREIVDWLESEDFGRMDLLGHEPEAYNPLAYRNAYWIAAAMERFHHPEPLTEPRLLIPNRSGVAAKVTVILPVYNAAEYLDEALRSVTGQTLGEIEILCVDDGSDDGSRQIIRRYAAGDDRFVLIAQPNAGPGIARNTGMDAAQGDYLFFLDADDILASPETLARMLAAAEAEELDILCGMMQSMTADGVPMQMYDWYRYRHRLPKQKVFSRRELGTNLFFFLGTVVCAKLYRRAFTQRYGMRFPQIPHSEDNYFAQLSVAMAERMSVLDETVTFYRQTVGDHHVEASKDRDPLAFWEANQALRRRLEELGRYNEVELAFRLRTMSHLYYNLRSMRTVEGYLAVYEKAAEVVDEVCPDRGLIRRMNPDLLGVYDSLQTLHSESPLQYAYRIYRMTASAADEQRQIRYRLEHRLRQANREKSETRQRMLDAFAQRDELRADRDRARALRKKAEQERTEARERMLRAFEEKKDARERMLQAFAEKSEMHERMLQAYREKDAVRQEMKSAYAQRDRYRDELRRTEQTLSRQTSENRAREAELSDLRQRLRDAEAEREKLKRSGAYRIGQALTAPLRALRRLFGRK